MKVPIFAIAATMILSTVHGQYLNPDIFDLPQDVLNNCFPSEKGDKFGIFEESRCSQPLVGLAKEGDEKDPNLYFFQREMNYSRQPLPQEESTHEIFANLQMAITPDQRQTYYQLAVSYAKDGMESLKEAKQVADYLYDDIARETCMEAIQIACTTIATGGNWQLALAAMSVSLGKVSPRLGQYWGYLDSLRMKAEACFNMHDFYMDIVRKG